MDQRIIYIVSNVLVLVLDIKYQQMSHTSRISPEMKASFSYVELRYGIVYKCRPDVEYIENCERIKHFCYYRHDSTTTTSISNIALSVPRGRPPAK